MFFFKTVQRTNAAYSKQLWWIGAIKVKRREMFERKMLVQSHHVCVDIAVEDGGSGEMEFVSVEVDVLV
jgi:hypothetical protein